MPPKPRGREGRRKGAARAVPRKKKGRKAGQRSTLPPVKALVTPDHLLQKVEECLDSFQYELAVAHCEKALQLEPQSLAILETAAPLFLEVGLTDRALEMYCFQTAVSLCPNEGHSKYMYLGQLSSGQEAVSYFTKGIEIMSSLLKGEEEDGATRSESCGVTRGDISEAYCAMAEVYLTDSCLTQEAEQHCYECCSKAVEWCPLNPEAFQAMASCLLSKDQREEAKEMLLKGLSLWLPGDRGERKGDTPPYSSRITCAKLLLELGEMERAFSVLESLLCEDDEVVVVWYLMGWLHYLWKDSDSAAFYLQQTEKLFSKLECDETDILEHTRELLQGLEEGRGEDDGEEEKGVEGRGEEEEEGVEGSGEEEEEGVEGSGEEEEEGALRTDSDNDTTSTCMDIS